MVNEKEEGKIKEEEEKEKRSKKSKKRIVMNVIKGRKPQTRKRKQI